MTSYPLMGELFLRCARIRMSIKLWIILRFIEYAVLDSKPNTASKSIYVLEYKYCVSVTSQLHIIVRYTLDD